MGLPQGGHASPGQEGAVQSGAPPLPPGRPGDPQLTPSSISLRHPRSPGLLPYEQKRTEWHEVFGRYCPHFAVDDVVAMPLPKPREFERGDEYKLSLSLEHYNFHTSWMRIVEGKRRSISIPMVHVTMVYAGEEVRSFRAKVVPLPKEYSRAHEESVGHFRNETHWPKLLVVKYEWEERDLVRVDAGILAITLIGVLVTAYLALGIIRGSRKDLAEFARESMADDEIYYGQGGRPLKGE